MLYNPLDPGRRPIHLEYSIGVTILSLAVAVLAVSASFATLGLRMEWFEGVLLAAKAKSRGHIQRWRTSTNGFFGRVKSRRGSGSEPAINVDLERAAKEASQQNSPGLDDGVTEDPEKEDAKILREGAERELRRRISHNSLSPFRQPSLTRILVSGTICGGSICGMHYIGQAAILAQYRISYNPGLVFFSVLIAGAAVCVGEYILFVVLAPMLRHPWWRRLGVALILAIAVNSMHYCAMGSTTYWSYPQGMSPPTPRKGTYVTEHTIIAFAACLAPLSSAALLGILIHAQRARQKSARMRSRRVLAAVIFDDQGRILTTTDGRLPLQALKGLQEVEKGQHRSWMERLRGFRKEDAKLERLAAGQPPFIACMEATWMAKTSPPNVDFVAIALAKQACGPNKAAIRRLVDSLLSAWTDIVSQLVGPQQASQHRQAVLYDRIVDIGEHCGLGKAVEQGSKVTLDGGQMMIITHIDNDGRLNRVFESHGYTFHDVDRVAKVLARDLGLQPERSTDILADVRQYAASGVSISREPATVYVAFFLARSMADESIQLMVDSLERHCVPKMPCFKLIAHPRPASAGISLDEVTLDSLGRCMATFAGKSLVDLMADMQRLNLKDVADFELIRVRDRIVSTMIPLLTESAPSHIMEHLLPRLRMHPLILPLTAKSAVDPTFEGSFMIAFRCIAAPDVCFPPTMVFTPCDLFGVHHDGVAAFVASENRQEEQARSPELASPARPNLSRIRQVETRVLTSARIFRILADTKGGPQRLQSVI